MAGARRATNINRLTVAIYKHVYRHGSAGLEAATSALELPPDEADAFSELARLGHISKEAGADFKIVSEPSAVADFLDDMIKTARRELISMHPGPLRAERPLVEGPFRKYQLAERDVRRRAIFSRRLTSVPRFFASLDDFVRGGSELREAPSVPIRMVVSDGERAVVPLDPRDSDAGAVVIAGELFARALVNVFEHCWRDAQRLAAAPEPPDLTEQERAVLRMLAVGVKDAKIARSLGVSLRTVSRIVKGLMHRLGADSRFQAGVRAHQVGWVD